MTLLMFSSRGSSKGAVGAYNGLERDRSTQSVGMAMVTWAVRLVFQTALENEVTEFFGRVLTPGRATQVASAKARAPATATAP